MRSQMTRQVGRRLHSTSSRLSSQPQCLYTTSRPVFRTYPVGSRIARTPVYTTNPHNQRHSPGNQQQRRTFLGGIFKKEPRALKDVEAEPGYETLLLFQANRDEGTRLPTLEELVTAWREFFAYKNQHGKTINSTQTYCAHEVLIYLLENGGLEFEGEWENDIVEKKDGTVTSTMMTTTTLMDRDLRLARDSLSISPTDTPEQHVEFARSLFCVMRRNQLGLGSTSISELWKYLQSDMMAGKRGEPDTLKLIFAFSTFGNALEARDILLNCQTKGGRKGKDPKDPSLWRPVLRGLAREKKDKDAIALIKESDRLGIDFDRTIHGVITTFFAKRDMVDETKMWWSKPIRKGEPPSRTTYFEVLLFAIRNGEQDWAVGIYKDLVEKLESGGLKRYKVLWDVAFQWAVLLLGKGPEHIEHMFKVCEERVSEDFAQPDIDSINRILQAAIEKNDPYLGERFIALAEKLGFEKNEETIMLQIDYRLRANDLDGAVKAFRTLGDATSSKPFPILNELIRKMGAVQSPDYAKMLEITTYLEQRNATLEPDTVVSLCMAFLRNDEQYEVMDTLSLHTAYYSIAERGTVRKAFVQYCLDATNSTARAWDAYSLLRQFFPELERSERVRIMRAFFKRKRADMACHVFGHMRAHDNTNIRPTVDTYVAFFEGIGVAPDETSLKMVHNMWKMDTTAQPNTELYNSLMVAYIACDTSYIALEFWKDITVSVEGPSYESLHLAFMAFEITSGGDELAVELWEKICKMEIEVPPEIYTAYVAAVAAHGNLEKAKGLLEDMQGVVGHRPKPLTLGIIHNALQSSGEREEFGSFCEREFPPVWEGLNKMVPKRQVEGELKYKFHRRWKLPQAAETAEATE